MNTTANLQASAPADLVAARNIAHQAVQLLTRAARANLPAEPDDSHSNLGWNAKGQTFWSRPLAGNEGPCFVSLSFAPLVLGIVQGGQTADEFALTGETVEGASGWLDAQLAKRDLKPASNVKLPYDLPMEVTGVTEFQDVDGLATLSAWFDFAHAHLSDFAGRTAGIDPGPSAVRCWPHHFDIATLVSLEDGDFETAKSIGVGLSPGDESYAQPYFYVNPWPHLAADDLPDPPAPGHWHTQGFVGAIATGEEVLGLSDTAVGIDAFLDAAFAIGRDKLGV